MQNNFNIKEILGTWKSEPRNTEWGEAIFKITFVKQENKSGMLDLKDIKNFTSLVSKLSDLSNEQYSYVKDKLSPNGIIAIEKFIDNNQQSKKALLKALNELLVDISFYKDNTLDFFHLNDGMNNFIMNTENKDTLVDVNLLLLKSIFPEEILKNLNKIKTEVYFKADLAESDENKVIDIIDDSYVLVPSMIVESDIVFISPYYIKSGISEEPFHILIKDGVIKISSENSDDSFLPQLPILYREK